jgi:hypothetical protein
MSGVASKFLPELVSGRWQPQADGGADAAGVGMVGRTHRSLCSRPLRLASLATSPVGGGIFEALCCCFSDGDQNSLHILQHVNRCNAQRENPLLGQPFVAPFIVRRPIPAIMCFTVNLNAKLRLVAVKIQNIRASRVLLAPVMAGLQVAQLLPQKHFGQRHFAAKLFRAAIGFASALEHFPLPRFALRAPLRQATPATSPRQARGGIFGYAL